MHGSLPKKSAPPYYIYSLEFAVLLPFEKDKTVRALTLSNNSSNTSQKMIELMTNALAYARKSSQG